MQHGNPDFAVQQWYQLNSATGQYMRIKAGGNWSRWVLQYSQFNLVGLASFDASNNPSGAIIQRGGTVGFNEYVRYADGTQICWGNTTTNVGATMAYQPLVRCRSISLRLLTRGGSRSRSPGLRLSWSTR